MSFSERKTKKGFLLSMIWSWIFIDTSVKERENFLIVGFPHLARPDLIFWRVLIDGASVKTKKGYSPIVWSWIFIDTSVNFDVCHRVFRRRLGVDSSFTSGVRMRMTTTCTPSATIKTSRRTVAVKTYGLMVIIFTCSMVIYTLLLAKDNILSSFVRNLPSYGFRGYGNSWRSINWLKHALDQVPYCRIIA